MNSQKFLGSNISEVKTHNMEAILLSFLLNHYLSRVELAQNTGLSNTTITNLTAELLDQGIIVEEDIPSHSVKRKVGRPRTQLRLVPDARYSIGVHIGIGLYRVAVTNLNAKIITNNLQYFDITEPAEKVLADICSLIEDTIAESGVDKTRIIGVGVGASGLVNHKTGVNVLAPRLNWNNVEVRAVLQNRLNLPVCVENNVRTMALAEAYFGVGRGVNVLAFVYGRIGVGAGFVVDGQLFRGSSEGAGEIGHTIVIPHGGEKCGCGNYGCLETIVSERVFIREANQLAEQYPSSLLAQYMWRDEPAKPIERLFLAVKDGDNYAKEMVDEKAYYLGISLANLVNVLNPEMIILGGMFAEGYPFIQPVAEKTMREYAFAGLGEKVQLKPTSFGWRAGVLGGASLVLTSLFYMQASNR